MPYVGTVMWPSVPVFHEVLNEKIAVFCDPGNVAEWVSAIRKLSMDDRLRLSMQKAAFKTAKSYSWKNRAKVSVEKFSKLLK